MNTPTRDTAKAIATATDALSAGNVDRARRALVYALKRLGLRGRVRRVPADAEILSVLLRACVAQQRIRELEAQRLRTLFRV